ncbi:AcrB/AcrD/AcrF family protein [candidate division KSB1 bacterium]|nr:MAG: AcrB/AcrD/AcrF family protein [candidate division KSB1 bacterium]
MNIPQFSVKYPVTVVMIFLAILLLGVISFKKLGIDLLPDVSSPKIMVNIETEEKPPFEIEQKYVKPLEAELSTLSRVKRVSSISRVSRALITVEFFWNTDMDFALLDVQKIAGRLQGEKEIKRITVSKFNPQAAPIMTICLIAKNDYDLDELRRVAENVFKRKLERLEGVAKASVKGGRTREIKIVLKPYKLEAYNISESSIKRKIRSANVDASGGRIEDNEKVYIIKGIGKFQDLEDVKELVIGYRKKEFLPGEINNSLYANVPVYLKEVADVYFEDKDIESIVRYNGNEGVGISIYKEAKSNTVLVSKEIKKLLKSLQTDFPDVEIVVAKEQALFINSAIKEVQQAAIYGIILAVIVLFFFLRNIWSTLIVSVAIPISIVATFNLMYFSGLTMNIMTLGGLALGAGMLVDNAIVVVENIFRHRELGKDEKEASIFGTNEVGTAIFAATLTTVIVFLPIVYVHGIGGELFKEQAYTVAFSLLSSLVVAFLLIPSACSKFLKGRIVKSGRKKRSKFYWKILNKALDKPFRVIGVSALLLIISIFLIPVIGNEFIPKAEEGSFGVRIKLPEGTRIFRTEKIVKWGEDILKSYSKGRIKSVYTEIGKTEETNYIEGKQYGSNTATILVNMDKNAKNKVPVYSFIKLIEPPLRDIPGAEVEFEVEETALKQTLGSSEADIVVEVKGPELNILEKLGNQVAENLRKINGLFNVRTSFDEGRPEVNIALDRYIAANFGLDIQTVSEIIKNKLKGEIVTEMRLEGDDRSIRVEYPERTLRELKNMRIETPDGAILKLRNIADIRIVQGPKEIYRNEQERTGKVFAELSPGFKYSRVVQRVKDNIEKIPVLKDYKISFGGKEKERRESFKSLQFALILSIIIVYMVLASLFESFLHPFTIIFSLPMAGIGAVFIFFIVGMPFSLMAYIGIIMLAGIAVNDAIIFVDYINILRKRGVGKREAILRAGQDRIRPILMTSLTTILALLPLSFGIGEGASLRTPLALAVIGGLITSTLMTLIVIPVIYSQIDRLRRLE